MTESEIEEARQRLDGVRTMLAADGYALTVVPASDGVAVSIEATGDACADCLAPERVVREIIQDKLDGLVRVASLTYPEASAAAH
jgi:Fe-S cluster biogenesis protein NfuA